MTAAYASRLRKFGARLRETREARGLERKAVAVKLGVNVSTYRGWERGSRAPTLNHLFEVAAALDVRAAWLLGGIS